MGEVPYRDFYALYPPGQYYAGAAAFALFGVRAIALRIYCVAVAAALAAVLHGIARRLAGRAAALAVWTAATIWLLALASYGAPTFPALLLVAASSWLLLRAHAAAQRGGAMFLAGAALGLAVFFRHDVAFYGLVASIPCAFAIACGGPGGVRRLAPYAAGIVVAFVPLAAWLLAVVPVREVVFELFTYPATTYAEMRSLPYPPFVKGPLSFGLLAHPRLLPGYFDMAFYAPLALHAVGLIVCVADARRRGRAVLSDAMWVGLASASLLGACVFQLAVVRSDRVHIAGTLLLSYPVAAALAARLLDRGGLARRAVAVALTLVVAFTLNWPLQSMPAMSASRLASSLSVSGDDAENRASGLEAASSRRDAAEFLRSVVPPGERIFVGCGRHDRVYASAPILYFLSGRLPGTKYHALDPGVATRDDVQRDICADLDRHRVEYVAIDTRFDEWTEPNGSSVASGSKRLDEYLCANYSLARRFGETYSVWRRSTPFAER